MAHTFGKVVPLPASEPGALAGFGGRCESCGLVIANTVDSNAMADVRRHIAYMEAKGR